MTRYIISYLMNVSFNSPNIETFYFFRIFESRKYYQLLTFLFHLLWLKTTMDESNLTTNCSSFFEAKIHENCCVSSLNRKIRISHYCLWRQKLETTLSICYLISSMIKLFSNSSLIVIRYLLSDNSTLFFCSCPRISSDWLELEQTVRQRTLRFFLSIDECFSLSALEFFFERNLWFPLNRNSFSIHICSWRKKKQDWRCWDWNIENIFSHWQSTRSIVLLIIDINAKISLYFLIWYFVLFVCFGIKCCW